MCPIKCGSLVHRLIEHNSNLRLGRPMGTFALGTFGAGLEKIRASMRWGG